MKDTLNPSYSLLNQKEIDALVEFLLEKKNSVDSDVMSQECLDKLIALITSNSRSIIMDLFDPFVNIAPSLLSTLNFRDNMEELCELRCSIDEETNYIKLTAYNTVTGRELSITPQLLNKNDSPDWGYSISPTFFNRIARIFSFKYTTETHDKICNIFLKSTFGTLDHEMPEIYLPTNDNLLACLM